MECPPYSQVFQSTHPVGGWDQVCRCPRGWKCPFQSTHPVGGWDQITRQRKCVAVYFNPPTPWGGGTLRPPMSNSSASDFNPPTPWGGGTTPRRSRSRRKLFQSTHPVGGWDLSNRPIHSEHVISIHPPRGGVGRGLVAKGVGLLNFNPPTPWGGGTTSPAEAKTCAHISIHPPRGGVGPPCVRPA